MESRGIDISRFGPAPVCSSMIVSVRWPLGAAGAEVLALLGGQVLAGVAADHEVRRAGLVVGPVAARESVDLGDLLHAKIGTATRKSSQSSSSARIQRNGRFGGAATSAAARAAAAGAAGSAAGERPAAGAGGTAAGETAGRASPGSSRSRVRRAVAGLRRALGCGCSRPGDLGGVVVVRRLRPPYSQSYSGSYPGSGPWGRSDMGQTLPCRHATADRDALAPSYARVSLAMIDREPRGEPARQRARRRDHEAGRLDRRARSRSGTAAARRSPPRWTRWRS